MVLGCEPPPLAPRLLGLLGLGCPPPLAPRFACPPPLPPRFGCPPPLALRSRLAQEVLRRWGCGRLWRWAAGGLGWCCGGGALGLFEHYVNVFIEFCPLLLPFAGALLRRRCFWRCRNCGTQSGARGALKGCLRQRRWWWWWSWRWRRRYPLPLTHVGPGKTDVGPGKGHHRPHVGPGKGHHRGHAWRADRTAWEQVRSWDKHPSGSGARGRCAPRPEHHPSGSEARGRPRPELHLFPLDVGARGRPRPELPALDVGARGRPWPP